jgi:hypothetical protein
MCSAEALTDMSRLVSEVKPSGSPFESYILFSFGYLVSFASTNILIPRGLTEVGHRGHGHSTLSTQPCPEHQISTCLCGYSVLGHDDLDLYFCFPWT